MIVRKEIKNDNELYLYFNGKLIYKRWLDLGYGKVFDKFAFDKYTDHSINDLDLKETPDLIHIKAKLTLYSSENGGRKIGIASGYRPNHVFEYQENGQPEYTFIGDILFDNIQLIMPGEPNEVTVRFLFHQPIEKHLTMERIWWIHEGPRKIGEAKILSIKLPKK